MPLLVPCKITCIKISKPFVEKENNNQENTAEKKPKKI